MIDSIIFESLAKKLLWNNTAIKYTTTIGNHLLALLYCIYTCI